MKFSLNRQAVPNSKLSAAMHRWSFLKYAGAGAVSTALLAAGCKKGEIHGVYLGTGDVAILNYAYALEQLEAAFYTQVVASPFTGMTTTEKSLLTDIRDHEVAHREFFKTALGSNAIAALEFDLSSVNLAARESVLAAARSFEDLGVAAYNGAGRLIQSADNLALAGKIVSVEARHAAWIRDLISYGSFADRTILDEKRMDVAMSPQQVLATAQTYIKTEINSEGLPGY